MGTPEQERLRKVVKQLVEVNAFMTAIYLTVKLSGMLSDEVLKVLNDDLEALQKKVAHRQYMRMRGKR